MGCFDQVWPFARAPRTVRRGQSAYRCQIVTLSDFKSAEGASPEFDLATCSHCESGDYWGGGENMGTAKSARALETRLDGYDVGADSECARAMAEAVLRELSLTARCTRQSNPGRPSFEDEKPRAQSPVSARSGEPRAA